MNADGSGRTQLTNDSAINTAPDWSPDGLKIAFGSDRQGNRDIYVMNADGSGETRLTSNGAVNATPAWSPDGHHIAFSSNNQVFVMNADGTGQTRLTSNSADDLSPDWQTIRLAAVGGIAESPDIAITSPEEANARTGGRGWSAGEYAALAGGVVTAVIVAGVGAWRVRKRSSR